MASTQEIQLFKALNEKLKDQNRAKELVLKFREAGTVDTALKNLGVQIKQPKEEGIEEVVKEPVVEERVIETAQPIQEDVLTLDKLKEIVKKEKEEAIEAEEGFTGFVAETGEALTKRQEALKDIKQRFGEKITKGKEEIQRVAKEQGAGAAFVESMKQELNKVGSSFQVAGQIVGAATDVLWEGVENTLQEVTGETVEKAIEGAVQSIGETQTVQELANSYMEFRENNPETARNIEAAVNIGMILPIAKTGKVIEKPFTKAAQEATRETARKGLKDTGRAFLNLPTKTKPQEALDITKFFANKVKKTQSFDDMVVQFDNIGKKAINEVDNNLAKVTKTYKPAGAKEVLKVIDENIAKAPFSSVLKKEVKTLLKKFDKEGLTLTELNKIKRSINEYTKAWTAAGKEATGVAPEAMRSKYREVMKFIENTAKREGLPDIGALNKEWINSNTLTELLSKQAATVGKKKGLEALQPGGVISGLGERVFELRRKFGLTDLTRKRGVESMDFEKVIDTMRKLSKQAEKKGLIEKGQITGAKALESLKKKKTK